ncbi:MAG: hypothetical protein LBD70_00185 [Bifidobacteriaceae bacterium]|jgi:molecular chaperone GrpE (heat shock protein)|nr:hypothetical protein [Bifidobacteriaceae bacterium]
MSQPYVDPPPDGGPEARQDAFEFDAIRPPHATAPVPANQSAPHAVAGAQLDPAAPTGGAAGGAPTSGGFQGVPVNYANYADSAAAQSPVAAEPVASRPADDAVAPPTAEVPARGVPAADPPRAAPGPGEPDADVAPEADADVAPAAGDAASAAKDGAPEVKDGAPEPDADVASGDATSAAKDAAPEPDATAAAGDAASAAKDGAAEADADGAPAAKDSGLAGGDLASNAELKELIGELRADVRRFAARTDFFENLVRQLQARITELQADQILQLLGPAFQRLVILLTQSADAAQAARNQPEGYRAEVEFEYFYEAVVESLELMGVESVDAKVGDPFDRVRHATRRSVATGDPALEWTVARVMRQGLARPGAERAFIPAQVAVYRHDPALPPPKPEPEPAPRTAPELAPEPESRLAPELAPEPAPRPAPLPAPRPAPELEPRTAAARAPESGAPAEYQPQNNPETQPEPNQQGAAQ